MSVWSYLLGAVVGGVVAWFFGYALGMRHGVRSYDRVLTAAIREYRKELERHTDKKP
jgi:membrane protein YqaA with SNARE-associated domain